MTNIPEYQKRIEERKVIKKETRTSMIIGLMMIGTCLLYGLVAYLIKTKPTMTTDTEETVYGIVNLFVVLIFISILGIRKSLYYSPKLIKEDFTLTQVLQKWRTVDIILLAVSEIVPICGLVLAILGMKFEKTFHFFAGTIALIIILIPMDIKVRSKLSDLRKHFPGNSLI
ncbi:MAG: hypothetical protein GY940_08085 [bacterium]|nr:hypothetical protein [bacterium]